MIWHQAVRKDCELIFGRGNPKFRKRFDRSLVVEEEVSSQVCATRDQVAMATFVVESFYARRSRHAAESAQAVYRLPGDLIRSAPLPRK